MPWKNGSPPLYGVWQSMLDRCYNTKAKSYKHYGGRGIKVCPRWHDYKQFYADVAPRPPGASLDRYPNNNGDYEPNNWRWANRKQQARNTRVTRYVTIDDKEYMLAELSEKTGVARNTIIKRVSLGLPYATVIDPNKPDLISEEARKRAGQASSASRKARTHCRRGHEFSQENTYWTPQNTRVCRACDALRGRKTR